MSTSTYQAGRQIILKSLEPEGEPWLSLSYEEGLKAVDDFWPSPEMKSATSDAVSVLKDEMVGDATGAGDEEFDGLMDDIDQIANFEASSRDGGDTIMVDALDDNSPAASAGGTSGLLDENSPTASHAASPQLPAVRHQRASTPAPKVDDETRDRSSMVAPSSELRSSMQKEMHREDEAAVAAAKDPSYPDIPPLIGLGQTDTAARGEAFKSLEPSASIVRTPQAGLPAENFTDLVEDDSAVLSPQRVQQHGRKHQREPSTSPETIGIGYNSHQTSSPTRPLAKKPRRRGRTTSQGELQIVNEAVEHANDAEAGQESAEHTRDRSSQMGSFINMEEDDSSLTDLTLNLDPDTPPEAADGESSSLPSAKSWNFDALRNASKPASDDEDAMDVDQAVDGTQMLGPVKETQTEADSTSKSRKDSFVDADAALEPSERVMLRNLASPLTKPRPMSRSMRAQTVPSTVPLAPSIQDTATLHNNMAAPRGNTSRRNSRQAEPVQKPQSREVAALVGEAGLRGISGGQTSIPRKTRGQKQAEDKALEDSSPNPSKAAKKRHPAAVDYSKML